MARVRSFLQLYKRGQKRNLIMNELKRGKTHKNINTFFLREEILMNMNLKQSQK